MDERLTVGEWARTADIRMYGQGRKILLFVDIAPSHPHLILKNVKVIFLPSNITSVVLIYGPRYYTWQKKLGIFVCTVK